MSRKKLNNLNQVHGKEETFKPSTLDQLWGDTGIGRYKTMNEADYAAQLAEMNKSDLIHHATQVGVVPSDDRERLTRRLVAQFKQHVSSYKVASLPPEPEGKVSKELAKILSEGR